MERCFMAANRVGKTFGVGGYETALHLTGLYPAWWEGRRFTQPIAAWAAGDTAETTRDIVQSALMGPIGELGTGLIPADAIIGEPSRRSGVTGAFDTARIRHVSGGVSLLGFKSYDQGRKKFQGTAKHLIWLDEEPPSDVYDECMLRLMTTDGLMLCTFTPLQGLTDIALRFMPASHTAPGATRPGTTRPGAEAAREGGINRMCMQATWDDVPHLTPAQKDALWDAIPEHQRDARTKGIPILGAGRVFTTPEEKITCEPFDVPRSFARIAGVDFGIDHPFAAARCAWDRDNDIWYVTGSYREKDATPPLHAAALRPWGTWVPIAWPHDGLNRDKGSGDQLAAQYRAHGINMLPEHATHERGGTGVEAGIMEMIERMQTGRFKVFRGLADWFEEYRLYHRKDGLIVKLADDLISATRYALMMRRYAEVERTEQRRLRPGGGGGGGGWMGT